MVIICVNMTIMPGPGQWRSSLSVSHNQECDHHYEGINPLSALTAHTDLTSDDPRLSIRGLISSVKYPVMQTLSRAFH